MYSSFNSKGRGRFSREIVKNYHFLAALIQVEQIIEVQSYKSVVDHYANVWKKIQPICLHELQDYTF